MTSSSCSGDNIYEGPATPEDYRLKFEEPYRELLGANVRFFAALGNHDDPRQISYPPFNMKGERYYSFAPPEDVLTRLVTRASSSRSTPRTSIACSSHGSTSGSAKSDADWKIVFLHHPLYTTGRYRRTAQRAPLGARADSAPPSRRCRLLGSRAHLSALDAAARHSVFRQRRSGIAAARRRRRRAVHRANLSIDDYHFMLVEIEDDALHFQAISRRERRLTRER